MAWYDDFKAILALDAPLGPKTWLGVGGAAKYFFVPRGSEELSALVHRLGAAHISFHVLGAGANLLVRDEGVSGAVLSLAAPAFAAVTITGNRVRAGAGADMAKLVLRCARAGLSGLECLAGIPGTVGGQIRMNAGGSFGSIGSRVREITVMDHTGRVSTVAREQLHFTYRQGYRDAPLILRAELELTPEDPQRLATRIKEIWMYKKNTQPLAEHSAGCIFRNAAGVSAGALIDQAGLKGVAVGLARVSERHANFIVARPGATARQILDLIELVRRRVREKFQVALETEVVIW